MRPLVPGGGAGRGAAGSGRRGSRPSYADVVRAARSLASLIGRQEGELRQRRDEENVTSWEGKEVLGG